MTAIERLATLTRQLLPGARPRAVVLVYHRVGERRLDPWRLTVDPEIFGGQMEALARDWSPLSLAELVEGLAGRRLPERAVVVTFDDGYADNLEIAAPILVEQQDSGDAFRGYRPGRRRRPSLVGAARLAPVRARAAAADADALDRW